jgi:hypothetical protein
MQEAKMKRKNHLKSERDTIPCPPPSFGEPIMHQVCVSGGVLSLSSSIPKSLIKHYKNYKKIIH